MALVADITELLTLDLESVEDRMEEYSRGPTQEMKACLESEIATLRLGSKFLTQWLDSNPDDMTDDWSMVFQKNLKIQTLLGKILIFKLEHEI